MKKILIRLLAFLLFVAGNEALSHPGSGIVVDGEGNVYFLDTGSGVWKIDKDRKLTKLSAPAYHWMALDVGSKLRSVSLPNFAQGDATVTRDSDDPRIIVSSDFPLTVGSDGALYYPWRGSGDELQIFRIAPSGEKTVFKILPDRGESGPLRWLNGLAASGDGSVYYSEDTAIRRISTSGELTTVVSNLALSGCDSVPEVRPEDGTYFRGLDVDAEGSIYVAATGCRTVLKITADGKATKVLRTSSPWSPTAVAVSGSDLYVLEYLHTPGDNRREWLPRVRKVSSDGTVVTIASINRP